MKDGKRKLFQRSESTLNVILQAHSHAYKISSDILPELAELIFFVKNKLLLFQYCLPQSQISRLNDRKNWK